MALYNNATNLQGRGNFAPGVTYYAGIKAPRPNMPDLPKGQYSFNINLDSIGRALAQQSRDQASVEETKFKYEYAQKEKAEAAAEKQLKLDMSNAYAQEIADVTAQVDQGRINAIEASRRIKTIDDRFRSYGVLSPSEMAPIRSNYDGGVSQYQEKTREQLRQSEVAFDEKHRQEVIEAVPSVAGESRDTQLKLWYDLNNADMQLGDAVKIWNANPNEENKSLLQSKADNLADWQTRTIFMNALNNDNRYSEADMYNMVVGGVDRALANRGVTNPQMRAYAATKVYNRYKNLAEAKASYTDEALKAMKNINGIIDENMMHAIRVNDPIGYAEAYLRNKGMTLGLPADRYVEDKLSLKQYVKFGGYETQSKGYTTDAEGNITDTVKNVPTNYKNWLLNSDLSPETMSVILGMESIPVSPILEAGSQATVAGSYHPSVTPSSTVIHDRSINPSQIATALENNTNYMSRTIDNPVTLANLKKQDEAKGTTYQKQLENQDRRVVYNALLNPDIKAMTDNLHTDDVLPFSGSGQYAALYDSLVIDENNGILTMRNNYLTKGKMDTVAAKMTAYNAKNSVKNINSTAKKLFPSDARSRTLFIRSLFDGLNPNTIPSYEYGMGGATLEPTFTESSLATAENIFDWSAKEFSEKVIPAFESAYNSLEKRMYNFVKEKGDMIKADYEKEKEADPSLSPEQYVKNKAMNLTQDFAKEVVEYVDKNTEIPKREANIFDKFGSAFAKGVESLVKYVTSETPKENETEREWDFQRGTVDVRDPSQLPIHFDEDGNWSNLLYGIITADGRTFVVPGLDEEGNISDNKTEFDKGRYFFSIKGDDKRSRDFAEGVAAKTREYVINRDNPYNKKEESILTEEIKSENTENKPLLERLNLLKFKNKDTKLSPAEKKIKENLDNYNTVADQIANLKDSSLEGFDEAVETVHDLGLDQGTALAAFTNITDEAGQDLWIEKYNELGEKSYANVRQALFLGASVIPAIFVAGGKGAEKGAELIESFMNWLATAKGSHIPTSKERKAQRKLVEALENIKYNKELYNKRYPENDFIDFPESLGLNSEPLEFRKTK